MELLEDVVSVWGLRLIVPVDIGEVDGIVQSTLDMNRDGQWVNNDDEHEVVPPDFPLTVRTYGSLVRENYLHTVLTYPIVVVVLRYVLPSLVQALAAYPLVSLVGLFFFCRSTVSFHYIQTREFLSLRALSDRHLNAVRRVKAQLTHVVFSFTGDARYGYHDLVQFVFRHPGVFWVQLYSIRKCFVARELRILNPRETLPGLITGTLEVDGFKLRLSAKSRLGLRDEQVQDKMFDYGIKHPRSLLRVDAKGYADPSQSLDTVPFPFLSAFLAVLESSAPSASSVTLQFTARGPTLPLSTDDPLYQAAVCALERRQDNRMPRRLRRQQQELDILTKYPLLHSDPDLPAMQQTTLPLYVTEADIIARVRSQCPTFTVTSVRDISQDYIVFLDERAQRLARRNKNAAQLHPQMPVQEMRRALRDEEFLTLWRAAVVRTNLLSRWEVILSKG